MAKWTGFGRAIVLAGSVVLAASATARAGGGPAAEAGAFEETVKAKAGGPAAPPTDADAKGKLGTEKMRKANRAAGEIVRSTLARQRPADAQLLANVGSADVVVVEGTYDRAQDVLAAMNVNHVLIPARLLDEVKLLATQTLLVNCPGNLSRTGIANLRNFVERGGHLVTTDWALKTVLERAFPGVVKHNGRQTGDEVVPVEIKDTSDPMAAELLAHVRLHQQKPRWWLEGASYPIKILDAQRVKVLVASEQMRRRHGEGAVVIAFDHGEGRVLHMTSHFYLQSSKLVARAEKEKGSKFAKDAGLSDADVAALKGKGVDPDEVAVGDINGAYAMQKLSANVVVAKQKANDKLLEGYRGEVTEDRALEQRAGAGKAAPRVRKGFRVKVLREEKGAVLVRDLFGNEGWLPVEAIKR